MKMLVTRGGCDAFGSAAELSSQDVLKKTPVVSSALQKPFGASDHKKQELLSKSWGS